jgi:hypothetical protein
MISKEKLVNGIAKFIESDLIPQIGDRNTKFVLAMAKDSLKEDEDILDAFFESPMVSSLVMEQDDMYDIGHLSSILKNVLSEYQSFPVTIPKIPLFSPTEKVLKITAEDVDKLMKYIQTNEMD